MKLSCKYTTAKKYCQEVFENILLIFNKIKVSIFKKKVARFNR